MPRRVRRRLPPVAAALAVLAVVAAATWYAVQEQRAGRRDRERAAVTAYLAALEPLAREGGRVVELGVKTAIRDLTADPAAQPRLADSSAGWQDQLRSVRARWAAQRPPRALEPAQRQFLGALDGYAAAAQLTGTAAAAAGADRDPLLRAAIDRGTAADRTWDEAAGSVRTELRRLGLRDVGWLPG